MVSASEKNLFVMLLGSRDWETSKVKTLVCVLEDIDNLITLITSKAR